MGGKRVAASKLLLLCLKTQASKLVCTAQRFVIDSLALMDDASSVGDYYNPRLRVRETKITCPCLVV